MFSTNIFWTFVSKFSSAVISLIVLMIAAQELGAERLGLISLIILGITIVQLPSGIFGGAGLVYLSPRHPFFSLLIPAYVFSVLVSFLTVDVLVRLYILPAVYGMTVAVLGILVAWYTVNLYLLLGAQRIQWHNRITLFQSVVQLFIFAFLVFYRQEKRIGSYLIAYLISYFLAFGLSLLVLPYSIRGLRMKSFTDAMIASVRYGFMVQVSSLLQLGNYRFTYILLKNNPGALGVFSASMQVAESLWIIARSISMVQFSKVSNSDNLDDQAAKTSFLVRLSVTGTILGCLVFFSLPTSWYSFIFGTDFGPMKQLIRILSPGILAVAVTSIISAYLSGSGRIWLNTISSAIGLLVVYVLGTVLVKNEDLDMAALSNVAAYLSAMLFSIIAFASVSKISFSQLLPNRSDIRTTRLFTRRLFGK